MLCTLDVFVTAWGMAPWILLPLYLLDEAGLVAYPIASGKGLLHRMLFYATLRSWTVAAERRLDLPLVVGRTLLLAVGALETVAMAVTGTRDPPVLWYNFPIRSVDFATYVIVKAACLLSLPLLEESVVAAVRASGGACAG